MRKKVAEIKAEINVTITDEDVDAIMATALEGGITYWADRVQAVDGYLGEYASDQISRGGKLRIHLEEPFDENDTEWYELDMEAFIKGIRLWLENGCDEYGAVSGGKIDPCDVDGDMADMIIQYALFGEVVFG
jgi:hypothetical protein